MYRTGTCGKGARVSMVAGGVSMVTTVLYGSGGVSNGHRHRIDKYLDTLLANQPISDGEATDRCQNSRRKMAD